MATILKAGNVASGAQITSDATGILEIRTGTGAGTTAMTVNTSQNVGVGTSSPNTRLQSSVGSSGSGVVNALRLQNVGTTVGDGARILFTAGTSTDGAGIASTGVALDSADLRFYTGGNTERIRIDSSGTLRTNVGGVEGIQLATDLNSSTVSSRLLFSETSSTLALFNVGGNLLFNTGATKGSTSGTTRVVFNANGVGLGGSTPSSGTGIAFPATQSASSDANTLDDYEEGTFTPVWLGTLSNPTATFSVQLGRYTKIGNLVYVTVRLDNATYSGGSGGLTIGGLPFTVLDDSTFPAACLGFKQNWVTTGPDYGRFRSNSTAIELFADNNTNETNITTANAGSSSAAIFSGCYRVS